MLDYVKWFKQLRDMVKTQISTGVLDHYTKSTDKYENATTDEKKKEAKKKLMGKVHNISVVNNAC